MELGCDGVLINTAIAKAKNPYEMAEAMKYAVLSGRKSYLSGRINPNLFGSASTTNRDYLIFFLTNFLFLNFLFLNGF